MKIAYVITRADAVGGASIHVRDLARGMRELGHDAFVLVGGGRGPVTEQLDAAGVPFYIVPSLQRQLHPATDLRAASELAARLRDLRPDVVSTHTAKAGWIGRAVSARLNLPVLYTPHGWSIGDRISKPAGFVFTAAERVAARWADGIICVCEYERQLALRKRIAPAHKLHVVYNGVRDVAPELLANPGASPCRIISVARFEPPKDHRTLLHALASFRDLPWELELIGDGPLEAEMRTLAGALGIADRVRFAGYQADPAASLAAAQLFVLSSQSEAFPRSVLEALRAGLPVVATDVGGVAEAVTDGVTGKLVPRADSNALAQALKSLITNGFDRQQMGAGARHMFAVRFCFETMLKDTVTVYATIVGNRTGRTLF